MLGNKTYGLPAILPAPGPDRRRIAITIMATKTKNQAIFCQTLTLFT